MSTQEQVYLERLGHRVRSLRNRRGMTRKMLARDSGVSERYLAQLETGSGNISILLLREIAYALGTSIEELVTEAADALVESKLLNQLIRNLTRKQIAEAHVLLTRAFGITGAMQRMKRLTLIGLRGAGKSTLGRLLAQHLNITFVELNKEIERDAGMPISEIMALGGQTMLRRLEHKMLQEVVARDDQIVLAVGGGLVAEPATYNLLLSNCFAIWLSASPEEHMSRVLAQGDHRPMADNPEAMADLRRILAEREQLYAQADLQLDTTGKTVEQSLDELARLLATPPRMPEFAGEIVPV
jgi:XRE family aerobic/anaerobic benzoate catabolism transcriptional regulator